MIGSICRALVGAYQAKMNLLSFLVGARSRSEIVVKLTTFSSTFRLFAGAFLPGNVGEPREVFAVMSTDLVNIKFCIQQMISL